MVGLFPTAPSPDTQSRYRKTSPRFLFVDCPKVLKALRPVKPSMIDSTSFCDRVRPPASVLDPATAWTSSAISISPLSSSSNADSAARSSCGADIGARSEDSCERYTGRDIGCGRDAGKYGAIDPALESSPAEIQRQFLIHQ